MSLGTTIFFNTKTASFWACEEISVCGHVCHENKHTIISCFKVTETEKQTSHKFVSNPNEHLAKSGQVSNRLWCQRVVFINCRTYLNNVKSLFQLTCKLKSIQRTT